MHEKATATQQQDMMALHQTTLQHQETNPLVLQQVTAMAAAQQRTVPVMYKQDARKEVCNGMTKITAEGGAEAYLMGFERVALTLVKLDRGVSTLPRR
ncbi:hypothetical protein GDO81_010382 [Engystomops pustulosus]|uniref:Uncharacterized protein n=1 Tax=Engystomops pustulosus TaxID=76066 RepID=A0AAV7BZF9_ENGPU|nr:hypothetical protein GDO81_010382 [Engystomops pustulosus]